MNTTLIRRLVATLGDNRLAFAIGLAVVILAVASGVVAGAAPLFGLLGIILAAAAIVLSVRRSARGLGPVVGHFALAGILLFGLIQLVPYGRSHTNPPVIGEPAWSSPETRQLMVNACFGCHSNEVEWPWYSNVAPISWLVTRHVDEGRDEVNYSEFTVDRGEAEETIEVIREGSMPPSYYTVFGLHPEARLTEAEIDRLVAGLRLTPGMSEDESEEEDDH